MNRLREIKKEAYEEAKLSNWERVRELRDLFYYLAGMDKEVTLEQADKLWKE